MENPKKYSNTKRPSFVNEPATIYETKQEITQQKNTAEQEILLKKLLALGLKQSKLDLGISNEEMKRQSKLKFPFLK